MNTFSFESGEGGKGVCQIRERIENQVNKGMAGNGRFLYF